MVTVLSGVSTSLLISGPEEEYLRMCSGLQHQSQVQQTQPQSQMRSHNIYSQGMGAPSHRYNAKASAIIHRCQMKNIHMRSQSMPEDAHVKYNQQQQQTQRPPPNLNHVIPHQQHQVKLEKRMSFANPNGQGNTNLRRSQTNAADLGIRLSAVQHYTPERQRFDSSTTSLNVMAARSRSNIAALNWNLGESELQIGRVPTNLSRATSFYHRDYLQSAKSLGFLGPPCKDLSRPLHVDCSVEYDLGNQPRIPKNSAPLLIIHPAYQQRFHPYSSTINIENNCDFSGEMTSTPTNRWPNCRFNMSYHNNYSQVSHQPQPTLDFDVTQSAPPKPQHRITRHSSFLVGGGVTSRQMTTQFRPIVPEDESLYTNYQHVHYPPRPFAPCAEMTTMIEHDSFQVIDNLQANNSVKRSKTIHPTSKGFHLSMPDISVEEGNTQFGHQRRQMALRNNGQHHHPRSRARTNLELKLEAARKMSTESHDSGTSLDSQSSDGLKLMPSFIDENCADDDFLSPVISLPPKSDSGTAHPSQAFSDSGLGTPSSLMDQDGTEPGTSYSSSSSSVSKWKSSVTGGSQVVWRAFVSSLKCMHF